jgi:glycosidase
MPLVYSGQEAGFNKRLSFFEKDLVEWKEYKLFDIYSKLFQLKKKNKALRNGEQGGEMIYLKSSDEKNVFAFTRSSEKDKVVAVFNLSSKPVEVKLIEDSLPGSYKNYFTGKLESFSTVASFELNPWEYRVYTK